MVKYFQIDARDQACLRMNANRLSQVQGCGRKEGGKDAEKDGQTYAGALSPWERLINTLNRYVGSGALARGLTVKLSWCSHSQPSA